MDHSTKMDSERKESERSVLLPRTHTGMSLEEKKQILRQREPLSGQIRKNVWSVLRYRSSIAHQTFLQRASYALELFILVLIILNVLIAIFDTSVTDYTSKWYESFLYISTIIFTFEYGLRMWSCVEDERYEHAFYGRIKWMLQPMSIIDLVALVPFYLELIFKYMLIPSFRGALTLRSLRLLRIVSFLRLERSYSAMKNLRLIFTRKKEELLVVSYLTGVIVLTASTTIFFLENEAQPTVFSSVGVCAWWAVETITSLGYGDIVPITPAGRFFSSILALWGIILFTIPGAILGSGFVEVMLEKQKADEEAIEEAIRRSFTRDIASGSFYLGSSQKEQSEFDTSPHSAAVTSPNSVIRLEILNSKMDQFIAMNKGLLQQLDHQQAQLDAILKLLESKKKSN